MEFKKLSQLHLFYYLKSIIYMISVAFFTLPNVSLADEGFYTFDKFPNKDITKKYDVNFSNNKIKLFKESTLRLNSGCSGSFISPNGLIMTNWHCTLPCAKYLSNKRDNIVSYGFVSKNYATEIKCKNLEAQILDKIIDVTEDVKSGNDIIELEEKYCPKSNPENYKCELENLYYSKQYKIYRYKLLNDIRLVFTPEYTIGYYGGNKDNFNFPRYNFDIALLRAYQNNAPYHGKYLKISDTPSKDNDFTLVIGSPGNIDRFRSSEQLLLMKNVVIDEQVKSYENLLASYRNIAKKHPEISDKLLIIENNYKALKLQSDALKDDSIIKNKIAREKQIEKIARKNPNIEKIDTSNNLGKDTQRKIYNDYRIYERDFSNNSALFYIARNIVRYKNNEGNIDYNILSNNIKINKEIEKTAIILWLKEYSTLDTKLLENKSPEDFANYLLKNTNLFSANYRKNLLNNNDIYQDPIIKIAKEIDEQAITARDEYNNKIIDYYSNIEAKRNNIEYDLGLAKYPKTDFSPRISFGKIEAYSKNGIKFQGATTIGEVYSKNKTNSDYQLTKKWEDAENIINKQTKLNMTLNNDVAGGNSGSAVINKDGEIIGLIFDGNYESISSYFKYNNNSRAIALSTDAIKEILSKIYNINYILEEIYNP